jgi:hypothetical protein
MKLIVGILTALLFSGVLIFSIEKELSFFQIGTGFSLFILPIIFFSSFKNNASVFIGILCSILFSYVSIKWGYYSTFIGVLLAFILGFPIHYYRVRKTQID